MISVELSRRFKKIVRDARRQEEVSAAIQRVVEGFGKPHIHSGLSIRKLGKNLYECRTVLDWRLVFEAQKSLIIFDFAGDHQDVQNYLRGR
jgi:mRNA-degrading endonuclease YafQ of YafQ-DinJ toxin-antitoxin module